MRTRVVPCGRATWGGSSAAVAGDPAADGGPDRLGRFLGHGAGEAVEVLDCFTGDVAVGVGGLQVAAQQLLEDGGRACWSAAAARPDQVRKGRPCCMRSLAR